MTEIEQNLQNPAPDIRITRQAGILPFQVNWDAPLLGKYMIEECKLSPALVSNTKVRLFDWDYREKNVSHSNSALNKTESINLGQVLVYGHKPENAEVTIHAGFEAQMQYAQRTAQLRDYLLLIESENPAAHERVAELRQNYWLQNCIETGILPASAKGHDYSQAYNSGTQVLFGELENDALRDLLVSVRRINGVMEINGQERKFESFQQRGRSIFRAGEYIGNVSLGISVSGELYVGLGGIVLGGIIVYAGSKIMEMGGKKLDLDLMKSRVGGQYKGDKWYPEVEDEDLNRWKNILKITPKQEEN